MEQNEYIGEFLSDGRLEIHGGTRGRFAVGEKVRVAIESITRQEKKPPGELDLATKHLLKAIDNAEDIGVPDDPQDPQFCAPGSTPVNPRSAVPSAPCTMRPIPYARQSIDEQDVAAVCKVLRSDWLTTGPEVEKYEQAVTEYAGAKYAVAVSSGTAALHLACLATGFGKGDEGITSPITFLASANGIAYCGATPRFADIDPRTYNISVYKLENAITERTRVVIPVHFAGQSSPMMEIRELVLKKEKQFGHKIFIIEDACHALGSLYQGRKVGCCEYADAVVFSFHPVKHVTTGEGGMVLTNNEDLAYKCRLLRNHGITREPQSAEGIAHSQRRDARAESETLLTDEIQAKDSSSNSPCTMLHAPCSSWPPWYYEQAALGYNYRITDIQCTLGRSQLEKLGEFMARRRVIFKRYQEAFAGLAHVTVPFETPECTSNFHLYVIQIDFDALGLTRGSFVDRLKQRNILTQVHYIPVHLQPYYQTHYGTNWGDFPVAEQFYSRCLSLPFYPAMSDHDVERVIEAVSELIEKKE